LHGFAARRDELEKELRDLTGRMRYDVAVLAVTDVALKRSVILVVADDAILRKIPLERVDDSRDDRRPSAHRFTTLKAPVKPR
jgi:hypothetical protein